MEENQIVKRVPTNLQTLNDLDTQLALMNQILTGNNRPADIRGFAKRNSIEEFDDNGQRKYIIRAREVPLEDAEDAKNGSSSSESGSRMSYAQRIGFDTRSRPGKYNDADKLFQQDYGTIEIGEINPVVAPF